MAFPSLFSSVLFLAFIFVTHGFDLSIIQMQQGICPYTVVVRTSCSSPPSTSDQISVTFGDADGNQVYAKRLGGPVRGQGILGQCSIDTFQVKGQCLNNPICSLYINRNGTDGWVPESVEIFSETSKSVKFDFTKTVPQNTWFGHNYCNTTSQPSTPGLPQPEFPPEFPPETPEFPPETPAFPPPSPPRPSAASGRGDGESVFAIATAVAVAIVSMVR